MKQRIGFIGAGLMGHGAARHILKAGYPVTVIANRNRAPIDDLVERGATEAQSVRELTAASDIVFLCLPDAPTVQHIIRKADGLRAGARDGLIVLDMTTSLPDVTRELAEELNAQGVVFVDAPMTRTPAEAEEGRLNVLLGGVEDVIEKVRPVLETFCENVWHIGPTGAAHAFKLVNNFIVISNLATVLEAEVAARRFGIDHTKLLEICSQGGASSVVFQKLLRYPISGDATQFQAHAATALKDVAYYNQMADAAGLHSMMSKSAQQFFQLACALGEGETLIPKLFDAFSELSLKES
jgi:3-hydroxyisobutyrate dehydrogenase-like beta-hydroxyacid dehydrogenase